MNLHIGWIQLFFCDFLSYFTSIQTDTQQFKLPVRMSVHMSGLAHSIHTMSTPSACLSEYKCLELILQTRSQTTPCTNTSVGYTMYSFCNLYYYNWCSCTYVPTLSTSCGGFVCAPQNKSTQHTYHPQDACWGNLSGAQCKNQSSLLSLEMSCSAFL